MPTDAEIGLTTKTGFSDAEIGLGSGGVREANITRANQLMAESQAQLAKAKRTDALAGFVEGFTGRGLVNWPTRMLNRLLGTDVPDFTGIDVGRSLGPEFKPVLPPGASPTPTADWLLRSMPGSVSNALAQITPPVVATAQAANQFASMMTDPNTAPMVAPFVIAPQTAPFLVPLARGTMAAQAVSELPAQGQQMMQTVTNPQATPVDKWKSVLDTLLSTVVGAGMMHGTGLPVTKRGSGTEPGKLDTRATTDDMVSQAENREIVPPDRQLVPPGMSVASTRELPTHQPGPVPPSRQLAMPRGDSRFVVDAAGRVVNLADLTEAEQAELMRGPKEYKPSEKKAYSPPPTGELVYPPAIQQVEAPQRVIAPEHPTPGQISREEPVKQRTLLQPTPELKTAAESAATRTGGVLPIDRFPQKSEQSQVSKPNETGEQPRYSGMPIEDEPKEWGQRWSRGWMTPGGELDAFGNRATHNDRAKRKYNSNEDRLKSNGYLRLNILYGDKVLYFEGKPNEKQLAELKSAALERGLRLMNDKGQTIQEAPEGSGEQPRYSGMPIDVDSFRKREKELRGEEFALTGPRMAVTPATVGFKDVTKEVEAGQLYNRIRNYLEKTGAKEEWDYYKDVLPREGKITPEKAAKLMQESGPRVEVRKLEAVPDKFPGQVEYSNLHHSFWEPLSEGDKSALKQVFDRGRPIDKMDAPLFGHPLSDEFIQKATRYHELARQSINEQWREKSKNESATARYTMVNPKPLDQMPGAVDLLVRVPYDVEKFNAARDTATITPRQKQIGGIKYESNHYPQEGKNLVAHVRGYMETMPDGRKVFHVFEVQSDWAQEFGHEANDPLTAVWLDTSGRPQRQTFATAEEAKAKWKQEYANYMKAHPDSMLPQSERLALKAAIEHARKQGADAIALSDAETAMMSEMHDQTKRTWLPTDITRPEYHPEQGNIRRKTGRYGVFSDKPIENGVEITNPNELFAYNKQGFSDAGSPLEIEPKFVRYFNSQNEAISFAQALVDAKNAEPFEPTQAKGMRLHYDQTLPRIAEELTGAKGERVEFGEHQNAFKGNQEYNTQNFQTREAAERFAQEHGLRNPQILEDIDRGQGFYIQTGKQQRENLIFRNPDSTPKTSVSARLYPLKDTRKPFSLFEKDKPSQRVEYMYAGMPFGDKEIGQAYERFAKTFPLFRQVVTRVKSDESPSYGGSANPLRGSITVSKANLRDFNHLLNIIAHEAYHLADVHKRPVSFLTDYKSKGLELEVLTNQVNKLFNSPRLAQLANYFRRLYDEAPTERRANRFADYAVRKINREDNNTGQLYAGMPVDIQAAKDALGKYWHKFTNDIDAFKHALETRTLKGDITAKRDAVDTLAFNASVQAENHIKLVATKLFGKNNADVAQNALFAVLEAHGDKGKLDLFERQAAKNKEAIASIRFARSNWSVMQGMVKAAKEIDDFNMSMAKKYEVALEPIDDYLKRMYEKEESGLFTRESKPPGIGAASKLQRKWPTIFSAIEDGQRPLTLNAAALVGKRTSEVMMEVNQKAWVDHYRKTSDVKSGKPIVTDLEGKGKMHMAPAGYTPVDITPAHRVAVLNGYEKLFDALSGESRLKGLGWQTALNVEGALKHGTLAFDSFHMFRIWQFRKSYGLKGSGYKLGHSILEYSTKDLDEAVRQGLAPKEAIEYANSTLDLPQGKLSKREAAKRLMQNGLNAARHSEAMYAHFIRTFPIIKDTFGAFNKFVFDKLSRGAMLEAGLIEFERMAKQHPTWTQDAVARAVSRDINFRFGNLGRQGLFKNKTIQDLTTLVLLAPRWVESMGQSEARSVAQLLRASTPFTSGFAKPRTMLRGTATLLAAYFVGTQVLNYLSTGHSTFENPEGHQLDGYIPPIGKDGKGFYVSPMTVAAELTHDMVRYSRTKGSPASAVTQIIENKLSPIGRALDIAAFGRDWDDKEINDTWERAKRASVALVNPTPLPLRQSAKAITSGDIVPAERQAMAMMGFKAEPETTREVLSRKEEGKSFDERLQIESDYRKNRPADNEKQKLQRAKAAVQSAFSRQDSINAHVPKEFNGWLKQRGLRIPGYNDQLKVNHQTLTLTDTERKEFEDLIMAKHVEYIKWMQNDAGFNQLSAEDQKIEFNKAMLEDNKNARKEMLEKLQSGEKPKKQKRFSILP